MEKGEMGLELQESWNARQVNTQSGICVVSLRHFTF